MKILRKNLLRVTDELEFYPEDEQLPAKIILISLHTDVEVGYHALYEGYRGAKRKNQVHFSD